MSAPSLVVLCGGLGGARLALALQSAGAADETLFVTNVADDVEVGGLLVCPDTDAVIYALAGRFDEERGWGVRGDAFPGARPGEPPWFNLGKADRAHHERRRELLASGLTLGAATQVLAGDLRVRAAVRPATAQPVRTRVRTDTGWLGFQEWLVRERAQPPARDVVYAGIEAAKPDPDTLDALGDADLVVLAASSPVASLRPTLALRGVRRALTRRRRPTVAISPVTGRPLVTDRDRRRSQARAALLAAVGVAHDPAAVAGLYRGLADRFLLDPADAHAARAVADLGLQPVVAPTVAETIWERARLADVLLSMA